MAPVRKAPAMLADEAIAAARGPGVSQVAQKVSERGGTTTPGQRGTPGMKYIEGALESSPFAGPIMDNQGNEILAEGEMLEQVDLDQFPHLPGATCETCMYWWADGINANLPTEAETLG